ncbi:MAG TPA: hypothetical protein PKC69_05355 [Chitinophagaceae bacterium]|nr:hypothetical protein [Chitinophagaceae bacterium]
MKKVCLMLMAVLLTATAFSQSEKYIKAMEGLVPGVDTTRSPAQLLELSNSFERIADAEKNQWLPYYYAAVTRISYGLFSADLSDIMTPKTDKIDPVVSKAKELLAKAEALSKDNSEIYVAKKMMYGLSMLGDVMNRYMTDGAEATKALLTAKQLNPENPRVYIQEGIDLYNTPEEYGGSKAEGKKKMELAKQKFETFKPESSIHPAWGMPTVQYYLNQ